MSSPSSSEVAIIPERKYIVPLFCKILFAHIIPITNPVVATDMAITSVAVPGFVR